MLQSHYHPRKKLLNRLQALITSPKRALEHAERDGIGVARDNLKDSTANDLNPSTSNHLRLDDEHKDNKRASQSQAEPQSISASDYNRSNSITGQESRPFVENEEQEHGPKNVQEPPAQVKLRPHLKIRIVTW